MMYLVIGIIIAMVILVGNKTLLNIMDVAMFIIQKTNGNNVENANREIHESLEDGHNIGMNLVNKYGRNNAMIILSMIIILLWPIVVLGILVLLLGYLYVKKK